MTTVQIKTQTIQKVFKVPPKVSHNSIPNGKPKSTFEDEDELHVEKHHDLNNNEDAAPKSEYKIQVVWLPNALGFLFLHFCALYGVYLGFTSAKLLTTLWMLVLIYVSALSTTMGAHRLYTHRTFKANKWIRGILVLFQTLAGQNCLWVWIRDHRQHHKYSDTDADPHNAKRGFFFSHIGWLMIRKHPDVLSKGKSIDMSDINADPIVMFQKKYYKPLFYTISMGLPVYLPHLLWNETLWNSLFLSFVARIIFSLNFTWLVNSAAHMYGTKPFSKDIMPVENWFVSFFGLGEGWHNYHHSFPWDYRAAEFGQYFNVTTTVIDYCAKKGWVYDLKFATPDLVKRHSVKRGDGSHPVYGKMHPADFDPVENY